MKEASGELNMTVVTIVAIAAIGVFFYTFIWPQVQGNITRSTQCSNAFNCAVCNGSTTTCSYYDSEGNVVDGLECPCK